MPKGVKKSAKKLNKGKSPGKSRMTRSSIHSDEDRKVNKRKADNLNDNAASSGLGTELVTRVVPEKQKRSMNLATP